MTYTIKLFNCDPPSEILQTPIQIVEAIVQRRSLKKAFLKISQNSQENTCARVSF